MQVKKEDIKVRILESAKIEFLRMGYNNASLRNISDRANLSKGAIYSYFKNKDALFNQLAYPAISFIEAEFSENSKYIDLSKINNDSFSIEDKIECFKYHATTVLENLDSFKLLLFSTDGSSLSMYRERIIYLYSNQFKIRSSYNKQSDFSEMFIHTLASTYISYLEEIVIHNPTRIEVEKYAEQMALFVDAGIKRLR